MYFYISLLTGASIAPLTKAGTHLYTPQCTMGCLERALSLDGTLDTHSRRRRLIYFIFSCVLCAASCLFTVIQAFTFHDRYLYLGGVLASVLNGVCSILVVTFRCKLTTFIIVAGCVVYALALLCIDMTGRTEYVSMWPMMVLFVDFLLVMQVPTRYSTVVVVCTLVYLFVIAAEETWRFGLLDIPGLMPQEHRRSYVESMGDCDVLPCKQSNAVNKLGVTALVFVLDFIATRSFARGLLKEQASMQRTIATVQDIASLLAGYDVEKVAELLEEHGGELPDGIGAEPAPVQGVPPADVSAV